MSGSSNSKNDEGRLSEAVSALSVSAKDGTGPIFRYTAWEQHSDVDKDGNVVKSRWCMKCQKRVSYKELIKSWRPGDVFFDAET